MVAPSRLSIVSRYRPNTGLLTGRTCDITGSTPLRVMPIEWLHQWIFKISGPENGSGTEGRVIAVHVACCTEMYLMAGISVRKNVPASVVSLQGKNAPASVSVEGQNATVMVLMGGTKIVIVCALH